MHDISDTDSSQESAHDLEEPEVAREKEFDYQSHEAWMTWLKRLDDRMVEE